MFKKIAKEVLITILLVAIVLLILAILLYDYNPIVKNIPESVKYEISEETSKELNTEVVPNDTKVIITYEVDNTDLKNAEDYNPGKRNPFLQYSTGSENTSTGNSGTTSNGTISNGTTNNSSNSSSGSNNSSSTNSSGSGYFQNTSTK